MLLTTLSHKEHDVKPKGQTFFGVVYASILIKYNENKFAR